MLTWSVDDAIAMELRHILSGDILVARQEKLIAKLVKSG